MKINNIGYSPRNEVIVVTRKPSFQAKKLEKIAEATEQLIPSRVVNRLELDITKAKNYKGKPVYTPAPKTLKPHILSYLKMLEVDWSTHIDPNKPRRSFQ